MKDIKKEILEQSLCKLETGIPGFDFISAGGLPMGRSTLLSGSAGSGKTVFACQFLAEGIRRVGQTGVFVTFEESPSDIRHNMYSLGWDIQAWEEAGQWVFVDASPEPEQEEMVSGSYDLGALMARIEHAVSQVGATRLAMDSVSAIYSRYNDFQQVRYELFRLAKALKDMRLTSLMTMERKDEYGDIGRFGVEEFVADNVLLLRNALEEGKRRRTIEILKFRGAEHHKGEYPFTVMPGEGTIVIPLSAIELKQRSSELRIHSGVDELDRMCGGGYFRDSIILVSGATGCGKTLLSTEFIAGGALHGERSLMLAYEESRDQLFRNAAGWDKDFESMEREGSLRVVSVYPESRSLEDHLISIKKEIDGFNPNRLTVDSLSALERVSSKKGFREFVIGLTSFIKQREVAGILTATSSSLLGGDSVTETHISTLTDSIILLRYVEMFGEMRRGLTVLKMRGSMHDKEIREFTIDNHGLHIGRPFRNITGIISGHIKHMSVDEMDRLTDLFEPKFEGRA